MSELCQRAGIEELELRAHLLHSGLGVGHGDGWEAKARALCDDIRKQKAAGSSPNGGLPATAAGEVLLREVASPAKPSPISDVQTADFGRGGQ
jgi:hypothetical protein